MAFRRGEVVLVPFPFTDLSTNKVRPAVVLSTSRYQQEMPDLILGALTSRVGKATGPFDYTLHQWANAGLRVPTTFKPVLFTLDPAVIVFQVGELAARDLAEIGVRVRQMLGL